MLTFFSQIIAKSVLEYVDFRHRILRNKSANYYKKKIQAEGAISFILTIRHIYLVK